MTRGVIALEDSLPHSRAGAGAGKTDSDSGMYGQYGYGVANAFATWYSFTGADRWMDPSGGKRRALTLCKAR